MAVQIQTRRDTAANWTLNDPTLADGEMGYETDTGKLKFGDGVTAWSSLSYFDVAGEKVKVSSNDTTKKYLEDSIVSADSKLTVSTINDGGDEDLQLAVNEANIDHDNLTNTHNLTTDIDHDALTNFVANEHIDWTSTSSNLNTTGTVTASEVFTKRFVNVTIEDPAVNDAIRLFQVSSNLTSITLVSVKAYAGGGASATVDYNIEERAETTPDTAGTDAFSSDQVADNDGLTSSTFANASFASGTHAYLTISAIANSPTSLMLNIELNEVE